eukprot:c8868_g1_i1.p1 GENE.c8868_g1_i1~~c8868_g1_i1.p1  ORF type:complete len:566 (+),score=155.35 c8868_g1_i1:210-1907(+)
MYCAGATTTTRALSSLLVPFVVFTCLVTFIAASEDIDGVDWSALNNSTTSHNQTTPTNHTHHETTDHKAASHVLEWTTPLFTNPSEDAVGTVLAFLSVVLGQSGGVGAGGLLVPVYIAVLRLGPFAIPLSKATITGSAIVGVFLNIRRRHPHADRPLIAYQVALVLGPMTLAGTIIGVLLTTIFPSWLITIALIVLLGFTTRSTWKKASSLWKKETQSKAQNRSRVQMDNSTTTDTAKDQKAFEMAELSALAEANMPDLVTFDDPPTNDTTTTRPDHIVANTSQNSDVETSKVTLRIAEESTTTDNNDNNLSNDPKSADWRAKTLSKILKRERKVSWPVVFVMSFTWVVVLGCAMLKGGHGTASVAGIKCNSGAYWVVLVGAFLIISLVTVFNSIVLNRDFKLKQAINFEFIKGDVRWSSRNTLLYPMLCIIAGWAAGLLGIGAGMIQSPMMLEMGILPEISSATAMFMVLFTSSSTAVQFLLLRTLRIDYALWYGSVGMVGAIAGQYVSDLFVYKYKRVSIMVYAVSIVTGLSAAAMGIEGILEAVKDLRMHHTEKLMFRALCA